MTAKVLVVDDESVTRRVVIHTLKPMNVEVISAESGTQALELALAHGIALAIVDINLPDMDGFEVMRRIKQLPHLTDVIVVAFTARNHPDDRHSAQQAGASGFLYKPFSTQELRDLVKKHLGLA